MSVEAKKGYGSSLMLLFLGILALHFGGSWLPVLIPAAVILWFATGHLLAEWSELTQGATIEACR
jgi:hypothetical protein